MEMGIFKEEDPKIEIIKKTIKKRLISLLDEGLEWVILSGQMGVEIWTAEVVLDLKEEYDICLGITPPFLKQHTRWPEALQQKFELLCEEADFYQPIYQKEYEGPYQFKAKDQFLIDHSQGCLILYDEDTPGSPKYFLRLIRRYRERNDYQLFSLTPMDLEETVEDMRLTDPDYWNQ